MRSFVDQPRTVTFEVSDWDGASREAVREELVGLSRQHHIDPREMFGAKRDVEPFAYLMTPRTSPTQYSPIGRAFRIG